MNVLCSYIFLKSLGFILILFSVFDPQIAFSQERFTEENGWKRHPNGGGWVHRNANIGPRVFVGPNARVYGGQFLGNIDIDGRVQIYGGRFETVSMKGTPLRIFGDAIIRDGFFRSNRLGDIQIFGDADIRGGKFFDSKDIEISGGLIKGGEFSGHTQVSGGTIEGNVEISNSHIAGGSISENAKLRGADISGNPNIKGNAIIEGQVSGNAQVSGGRVLGRVEGDTIMTSGVVEENVKVSTGTVTKDNYRRFTELQTEAQQELAKAEARYNDKMKRAMEILRGKSGIGIALALATVASEVVKGETHILEALPRLADESDFSGEVTSSDTVKYTIDDILEELKTRVQELDPTKAFSQERQNLHNQLRTLYTDVQVDTGLSDEEKEKHLKTIAEIQDIVQPPSPPRNPPRRRNRGKSQPAQGDQGSLDSGDVKQEHTDNLRQDQPIRGIASTGMCLASDTKTISHQCLQQCACLLMSSNSTRPDTNQKSVNQEV